jgi:transposase
MTYTQAAVERAMKVYEVLVQALKERQPWIRVAEVLGVSARTVRRLRWRYEHDGFDGLFDHRRRTPSPRRAPIAEVQAKPGMPERMLVHRDLGRKRTTGQPSKR